MQQSTSAQAAPTNPHLEDQIEFFKYFSVESTHNFLDDLMIYAMNSNTFGGDPDGGNFYFFIKRLKSLIKSTSKTVKKKAKKQS